ncbi:MAG TPA: serine hydrolase [Bryobacteraceae bacterium]|jgi:CubicO group peptidase (beta-lactamase class C family)|nr:serine hydrolase [Bryobacteraceae bacterium]
MSFSCLCLAFSIAGLLTAQPTVEQHIRNIQDAILPAVITKGEPVASSKLTDRMAALHVPGVSIAVIHDGKIEWARGFGVTRTDGPAVTPDTLFQAASISKPVAAMAVLHIVQSGKLNLDTDVNQYLKTWKVPENSFTEKTKVTLRELLSHTAGMTVHGFPGYASNVPEPTLVQILNGQGNTPAIVVDTTPGTIWRYSGGGFVVAQLLLQDVTGQPFPKLMHDTVLGPAGMARSTYEQPLPPSRMPEAAMAYQRDGQPVKGGPHVYPEMAPAGLWTTPSDLARFAIEIQKDLAGRSGGVLSQAMAQEMLKPGMNKWGIGIGTGGEAAHPYFTHGGANEGFQCNLVAYNSGDGAAIMTNSDNGGQLASEILRTIAHEYGWPDFQPSERMVTKADPKLFDGYVGGYGLGNAVITVTREGDQMYAQLTGQPKFEIFPKAEHEFFLKVVDAQLTFAVGSDGKATQLTLHQNGMNQTALRLNEADVKRMAEAQAAAAKRFKDQTQMPGSEAALRRNIEDLRLGEPKYELMIPALANITRQQLPQLKANITALGALESVTFKGVGPGGADIYEVKFAHGSTEWRIMLDADGKISSVGFRAQ